MLKCVCVYVCGGVGGVLALVCECPVVIITSIIPTVNNTNTIVRTHPTTVPLLAFFYSMAPESLSAYFLSPPLGCLASGSR